MANDASLLSSLDVSTENKSYVATNFSLDMTSHDDIPCWHDRILDMYHVPNLSENLLLVS